MHQPIRPLASWWQGSCLLVSASLTMGGLLGNLLIRETPALRTEAQPDSWGVGFATHGPRILVALGLLAACLSLPALCWIRHQRHRLLVTAGLLVLPIVLLLFWHCVA